MSCVGEVKGCFKFKEAEISVQSRTPVRAAWRVGSSALSLSLILHSIQYQLKAVAVEAAVATARTCRWDIMSREV